VTGRWGIVWLFVAAAIPMTGTAVGALGRAVGDPAPRPALISLYFVLRAGVAIAFAILVMRRPPPLRRSRDPLAFAACGLAMLSVLALGGPTRDTTTALVLAGDAVAVLSCAWLLVSVVVLGRCFGLLPEARGLVTRGPYRVIRHPVYLGEIGICCGLVLASPAVWNVALLGCFALAQAVRMRLEERALAAEFPQYARYAESTGRLLPRLRVRRSFA
jgi:protein-S-isoprenylcysteine O-methyltransferase Ste14